MKPAIKQRYASLGADGLVIFWLGIWCLCNLVQAGYTELANDEAYYHLFAGDLAWGYFDHPPLTALLARMGMALFGGELGVRFFFVILQPLYLWMLWRLIRPADATRRDASLYVLLAAATLMLQLYGFLTVPDAPLMMTSALFLLTFKWFSEQRRLAWLWMGLAMAAMAYAKYHGALVVLIALIANPRLFRRPTLYLSGTVTLLLLVPHLLWQAGHDWASFAYHLSDRNSAFAPHHLSDYLLNLLVVFNPFFFPLYIRAWRAVEARSPLERALKALPVGFIGFFLLSALRGPVQPQWVIVSVFGLLYVLFTYTRRHPRTRRYLMRAGGATLALVALVRIEMIFNPLNIRYEIFDNPASYGAIAEAADGRPVLFRHRYSLPAKYLFYAGGGEAYCPPELDYRTHQWQFRDDDDRFIGREIIVECSSRFAEADTTGRIRTIRLANGRRFSWFVDPCFRPLRRVAVEIEGLPAEAAPGDTLRLGLHLTNPYPYDIPIDGTEPALVLALRYGPAQVIRIPVTGQTTLSAHGDASCTVEAALPADLPAGRCKAGFALERPGYTNWFNGKPHALHLLVP